MPVQAACPACGGPVEFGISSSMVTICEYCRTVVARGDRDLEDHGKVAELAETGSPLQLGLRGKYRGKRFELVGRAQFQHGAGGVWDEWYAAFSNRKWGWLAEAQGKFYLTFEKRIDSTKLPSQDQLEVGRKISAGDTQLTVTETGTAKLLSAEGEIPYRLEPNEQHDYADLSGPNGAFATFDFSGDSPTVYLGKEVTLDDIGVAASVRGPDREARQISSHQVKCPQCAGPMDLVAPDQTLRVCCPSCGALSDVEKGNLKYLETLKLGKARPLIPLGSKGTVADVEYTVMGFVRRFVTYEGMRYFWSEYLLYNPRSGFRWMIHSENHWSFAEPIPTGDVSEAFQNLTYQGNRYRLFQTGTAEVSAVLGQFYWKVHAGESVMTRDYVSPPSMISVEISVGDGEEQGSEINYTRAKYMTHEEVERAFDVEDLTRGWKVAPNQPHPIDKKLYLFWGLFAAILFGLYFVLNATLSGGVDGWLIAWALFLLSIIPGGSALYGYSFEHRRWEESDYSPYSTD